MHLQPQTSKRVVNERLHDPRGRVKLVNDSQFVRRPRRPLVLVANTLLLFAIEKLIDPPEEVLRPVRVRRQAVVDQPEDDGQCSMRRPDTRVFVVGVEENSDLAGDEAEGLGEAITKKSFLSVIFVLVSTTPCRSEVAEVPRPFLTRDRRDDFGLFR